MADLRAAFLTQDAKNTERKKPCCGFFDKTPTQIAQRILEISNSLPDEIYDKLDFSSIEKLKRAVEETLAELNAGLAYVKKAFIGIGIAAGITAGVTLLTAGACAFVSWCLTNPLFTPAIMAELGAAVGMETGGVIGSAAGLVSLAFDSTLWDTLKTLHKLLNDNMDKTAQLNTILPTLWDQQNFSATELKEISLTL